ncbi:MAG: hypothetical protein IKR83_04355 [Bacteroidales bacterium]|nr:hypothetical protein [Bacteroidales bacterium]
MEDDMRQQLKMMTDGFDEWFDRRRRQRAIVAGLATFAVVVTVGLLVVGNVQPSDGLYVSNQSHRTETVQTIDQVLLASL